MKTLSLLTAITLGTLTAAPVLANENPDTEWCISQIEAYKVEVLGLPRLPVTVEAEQQHDPGVYSTVGSLGDQVWACATVGGESAWTFIDPRNPDASIDELWSRLLNP